MFIVADFVSLKLIPVSKSHELYPIALLDFYILISKLGNRKVNPTGMKEMDWWPCIPRF